MLSDSTWDLGRYRRLYITVVDTRFSIRRLPKSAMQNEIPDRSVVPSRYVTPLYSRNGVHRSLLLVIIKGLMLRIFDQLTLLAVCPHVNPLRVLLESLIRFCCDYFLL